jgi:predicted membrane-bound dolichyl-phosphate-mannose-protein mannosyltransferase
MSWRALKRIRVTPTWALLGVLGASIFFRTYRLREPNQAIIFDERYYVNAARIILGWHVAKNDPYAGDQHGIDPNHEHPPLGKVMLAGSMKLFGNDPLGWRLPSLLAGVASIVLIYLIVRAATGDAWLGVIATSVFAFDNLVLVHSRIATLDMPSVAFLLLGVWLWMLRRPFLAGAACALAALIKLPAVYGLAALLALAVGSVVWQRVRARAWSRPALLRTLLLVVGFALVWIAGLWVLDLVVTPYNTPWAHLRYMLDYGFSLSNRGGPANVESNPWQWLANQVQMPYFKVDQNISVNGQVVQTRPITDFEGAMNPVVIGVAPLAFAYVLWRAWRFRDRLSLWVVAWVAGTYLSYYPLVLINHRTTYIFYFLPTLPAVAVAIAQLLRQSGLPRLVIWGYFVGLGIAFIDYFPFRGTFF